MSSVEKLAHISANIVVNQEVATWVIVAVVRYVKYQIIQNYQFLTILNLLLKLGLRHHLPLELLQKIDIVLRRVPLHPVRNLETSE